MKAQTIRPRSSFQFGMNFLAAILFALVSFAISGCETTGSTERTAEKPGTVSKGMSEAEVIAILGEPREIEEVKEAGVVAQIWRYEKQVVLSSTIESNGEQERSYIDHKTGSLVTVREPIYRNESVKGTVVAELLMVDGKVVALKEKEGVAKFEVGNG